MQWTKVEDTAGMVGLSRAGVEKASGLRSLDQTRLAPPHFSNLFFCVSERAPLFSRVARADPKTIDVRMTKGYPNFINFPIGHLRDATLPFGPPHLPLK